MVQSIEHVINLSNFLKNDNGFHLNPSFIAKYYDKQPNWSIISYITYKRTYARFIDRENRTEEFFETLQRVVEGTFTKLKEHYQSIKLDWNESEFQPLAQEMFERMWTFKFIPAGRGLWMMGTDFVKKYGGFALNNCSFCTTENINQDALHPFEWGMDCLMLGVGVGFDTNGKGKITIKHPNPEPYLFIIPDSRKGWTDSVKSLLSSFFYGTSFPIFDYSQIRKKGERIKSFGGICEGYEPLKLLHDNLTHLLTPLIGNPIRSIDIIDIFDYIAKCVVSGNVRRSALLSIGDINDSDFITCKENEELCNDRRANSNNSIIGKKGMNYSPIISLIQNKGEPAVVWLDNAREYSRMGYLPDFKDIKIKGFNPCFAGTEKLLTVNGEKTFNELNEKEIDIITPTNQIVKSKIWCSGEKDTIKLTFGNWTTIILTPEHIVMTSDGREIQAKDTLNERIRIHKEPINNFDNLWVKLGFIQGDGQLSRLRSESHLGIEINIGKKDTDIMELFGYTNNDFNKDGRTVYTTEFSDLLRKYQFDEKVLPERILPKIIPEDKELSFLRGLYSANGCIINSGYPRISFKTTCKKISEQIQLLLLKYGIGSYITTNKPKNVKFSNGNYLCKESYDLNIGNIESIVLFYEKIGFVHKYKSINLEKTVIKRSPKVIKIEQDKKQKVYDFSANPIHWGYVNGYLVHNCAEIGLFDKEVCNLGETFISKHTDYEDYERTLFFVYLYVKIVTLFDYHWKETDDIVKKNRRIGISQSGIMNAYKKFGKEQILQWCDKGYNYLKRLDKEYSQLLQIPESIKLTTVKPSGCQIKETLVNTSNGIFKLEELGNIKGEQWQKISNPNKTSLNKEITQFYVNGKIQTRKIITEDGNELEASLNHKYKIYSNNKFVWKQVSELQIGDKLIGILNDYTKTTESILKQIEKPYCNVSDIIQPILMSPKLAWLIGVIFANGSVHTKGLRISINRKQDSLIRCLHDLIKELFNIDTILDDDHSIYINSTYLLAYLKENGILKSYSEDIKIPLKIRTASRESIKSFINGFWRCDGGIHNGSTWSVCTVSKDFALQLLTLCRTIGINVKIKKAGVGGWGSLDRFIITSRDIDIDNINSRYQSKELKNRLIIENNIKYWLDPIEKIEDNENETFDISVDETHEYIANGVISHNSVSLLANVASGIHYSESEYYIRRIRFAEDSELIPTLRDCGYHIEKDGYTPNTLVVEFPIQEPDFYKAKNDVSIWDQVQNAVDYQHYWADNQISITVTFKESEQNEIEKVLKFVEDKLKGISFLKLSKHGYKQAPFEAITKEQYEEKMKNIKPIPFLITQQEGEGEQYCSNGHCKTM